MERNGERQPPVAPRALLTLFAPPVLAPIAVAVEIAAALPAFVAARAPTFVAAREAATVTALLAAATVLMGQGRRSGPQRTERTDDTEQLNRAHGHLLVCALDGASRRGIQRARVKFRDARRAHAHPLFHQPSLRAAGDSFTLRCVLHRPFACLVVASSLGLAVAACGIDTGVPPDAGACAPSTRYFVTDVAPRYLQANHCGDIPGCHGLSDGHGYLRLASFASPPDVTGSGLPLAEWPATWRNNYLQSIQLVRCDDATKSRLVTVPEGAADPHPPGDYVADHGEAESILDLWVRH